MFPVYLGNDLTILEKRTFYPTRQKMKCTFVEVHHNSRFRDADWLETRMYDINQFHILSETNKFIEIPRQEMDRGGKLLWTISRGDKSTSNKQ